MLDFLNQSNFPLLWKIFQFTIGGTVDKRRLCLLKYKGQKKVLEIGCSLGNISKAFVNIVGIDYTGIDTDPIVINYAKKDFKKYTNFSFFCISLENFVKWSKQRFGYILFAGVCHHAPQETLKSMFRVTVKLLEVNGEVVIIDPLRTESGDSRLINIYMNLERGRYLRKGAELLNILTKIPSLELKEVKIHFVGATPFSWFKVARFGIYVLSKK